MHVEFFRASSFNVKPQEPIFIVSKCATVETYGKGKDVETKDERAIGRTLFIHISTATAFLMILTVSNVYCGGKSKLEIFDRIITSKIAIGKNADKYPLTLSVNTSQGTRDYIFEFQFQKSDPYHHYICSISAAAAGTFINPEHYQKEYNRLQNEYKRDYPHRWEQQLRLDFPNIGARAQRGHMFFGPGGASYQLMFTTSDGKYDIKIRISNLLPENVESPDLGLEQIAKAISDHYNDAVKPIHGSMHVGFLRASSFNVKPQEPTTFSFLHDI